MTTTPTTTRHRRPGLALVAALAAVVGVVLVVVALRAQQQAPQPPRSVGRIDAPATSAPPSPAPSPAASSGRPARSTGPVGPAPLPASKPVSISIPAIGVRSPVLPLGLAPDGTLAVPQPGPDLDKAAWFDRSPTPGQQGPAIIEGHVDSDQGPSVFFELGKVRPGNRLLVTRADGVVAVFTVDAVRDFPKSAFPTRVVYGAPDLSRPLLRLITCSDFDASIGHHTGNEVVFAHLSSTRKASS